MKRQLITNTLLAAALLTASASAQRISEPSEFLDSRLEPNPRAKRADRVSRFAPMEDTLRRWNTLAVDASGLDHTPVADGEDRVYGEQLGPCRASRAIAIVHIAMFEAQNAVAGQPYQSYLGLERPRGSISVDAAIAQAAHDTLAEMFPSQAAEFSDWLAEDLEAIPDGSAEDAGVALGQAAAAAILSIRADDHSDHEEPEIGVNYFTSEEPGKWRQAPQSEGPVALGALWGTVTPFTMTSADQFLVPAPPALDSADHTIAYEEAKRLGGDGVITPTERTEEQTFIGTYWAYDGTPSLCAPPRLYNQLILNIADQMGTTGIELSHLLVLANMAMADTAIAAWHAKYFHDVGRPATMIREAGGGPYDDGNPDTIADENFTPMGAPASNLLGPNFTPPFPTYPSGHAAFGGTVFETLRRYYGTDDIAFTFVSDEYNGETLDNEGNLRELKPRSFESLSQAETENGQSRIYLGIHWAYDATSGITQGRNVAENVMATTFRPASELVGQTMDDWREIWYGTGGSTAAAADDADDADPYATGIPNLQVYAFFGMDQAPSTARIAAIPQPQLTSEEFSFRFIQPAGVSGISYGAQWSADLVTWSSITDTGSGNLHAFNLPVDLDRSHNLFMRLTVTTE